MFARRTIAIMITAAAAAGTLFATAGAASADGTLGPGPDSTITVNSVVDGGFESTSVGADGAPEIATWEYADSEYGFVACTLLTDWCGTNRTEVGPRSGNGWAWFGDSTSPTHTASLSQSVTIPVGATELTYWYRNASVDAPSNAVLEVKIDGTLVNFHQEGTAAMPDYAKYATEIARFADGAAHELSFEYDGGSASTSGLDTNSMEIDDVEILTAH